MAFTSSLSSKNLPLSLFHSSNSTNSTNSSFLTFPSPKPLLLSSSFSLRASKNTSNIKKSDSKENQIEDVEEEIEEELPWIQEKALDVVEFTGSVTQAIPGPRVGPTSLPWILAIPLSYAAVTFVIAFVKTLNKFTSPKAKRRKLVGKNATLCKSLDDLFKKGRDEVKLDALKELENKTGFDLEGILRKYIRYALNEKPFNPDLVADLIQLRSATMLNDSQVADILNEISRRVVRDKGPIVLDKSGYTEKGFKRKLAVQALFGKIFYLSELPEFCSRGSSLIVKEIFGVTDEDADKLRIHTISEAGSIDSLERMVDASDSEDSGEASTDAS
ncbi:hypothetical protein TanjilG_22475 [Lupinus angustifolius]|uniref:Armadillo-like repeats domain-containing protein n=1 Tax=Lupinus angustifolius TaxID=3871 RepID=A0A4P1RSS1_LUPAN|nr:PREDICTED: uncharacterized protein LOC109330891 [Lupinus angustifolius]OIW17363.1 hypothetical protein TanjilG_22475 [Lupinus angustifolius]